MGMGNKYPDIITKGFFLNLGSGRSTQKSFTAPDTPSSTNSTQKMLMRTSLKNWLVMREFTMKHYGGDPFSPEQLLDEISKVEYSGIKWNKLKI